VFSHLVLEREGPRYRTVERTIVHESPILLTPYASATSIDGAVLERFIQDQYEQAGYLREEVDSGAVILTGTALMRENSRMIADLFAAETGKFVAVSAGDRLEASLAAHGSGAAAASAGEPHPVLNVDIGGGTTKFALCDGGAVRDVAAIDVGARLVAVDKDGTVTRVEDAGRLMAKRLGFSLEVGKPVQPDQLRQLAAYMAERLTDAMAGKTDDARTKELFRTPALALDRPMAGVLFSGGVSEFIYGREPSSFGDLGPMLAEEIRERLPKTRLRLLPPAAGIRATVVGASQHTVQVSGNTIFISSEDIVPVRNVPVARPHLALEERELDPSVIAAGIRAALHRIDLHPADQTVALAIEWRGSASFARLAAIARGILDAEAPQLAAGQPLVLICDSDVGGLLGLHLQEEYGVPSGIVSIDSVELREFDYIDVGALLPSTGAAPVVIKSLVFPGSR
jgi:ethanolamine utilization protein EutA